MNARTASWVLASGALFGAGLAVSQMIQPEVVLAFLHGEDCGLLLVLGGAVLVTMLAYQLGPRLVRRPFAAERFGAHTSVLDRRTIGGAAIFGIGWGLCGVCPGPAVAGLGAGNWPLLWALAGLWCGAYAQGCWADRRTGTPSRRPDSAPGMPSP
jgi:uncharacterized membrane protein YedE/YeeE